MSKFLDLITHKLYSRQYPDKFKLNRLKVNTDKTLSDLPSMRILNEYHIEVRYADTVHCHPDDLDGMLSNFREQLKHAIYGDLYEMVMEAEQALYERDAEKLAEIIRRMKKEIWE